MNGQLTEQFTVQRGVRQGSPMLFLIVMDSLLVELANANCGVSVQQIYTGSFGQADDLRCVAPNLLSVEQQAFIVKSFTDRNFLKLNMDKLEILEMTNGNHVRVDPIQVGPVVLKPSSSVTCLGVIWSNSLSPKESIAYNISKARRSFFASGVSKHKLNPLSSKEVFEVCSLSICLYGCENWLLTDQLLKPLEDFQAEVAKTSCQCQCVGCFRVANHAFTYSQSKLSFLWKLMNPQYRSISSDIFKGSGSRTSYSSAISSIGTDLWHKCNIITSEREPSVSEICKENPF